MTKGNLGPEIQARVGRRTTPPSRFIGALPPILLLGWLLILLGLPSGCGGGNGGPDASNGGQGSTPDTVSGGEAGSPIDCDDGKSCTLDVLVSGRCTHSVGPNSGDTACPDGEYCTAKDGCTKAPACATEADCAAAWKADPCKTKIACDGATATCTFEPLDKDADGFAAAACGGGDCDDADVNRYPGNTETCDGRDNNCDGAIDEQAMCSGFGATCKAGACVCPDENTCGSDCVDMQTDAAHCGDCKTKCAAGLSCVAGACTCSDPAICGECDPPCADGASCSGKTCKEPVELDGVLCEDALVVDGNYVYWADSFGVGRTPIDASSPSEDLMPLDGVIIRPGSLAVDDTTVYVAAGTDNTSSGFVFAVPKAGGKVTKYGAGLRGQSSVAVDSSYVYWSSEGLGKVQRAPLTGGTPEDLASLGDLSPSGVHSSGLIVDGNSLFVAHEFVWSMGLDGTSPKNLTPDIAGGAGNGFAMSQGILFFAAADATGDTVMRLPIGGKPSELVAPGLGVASTVAVGGADVYWGTNFSIVKAPAAGGAATLYMSSKSQIASIAANDKYVFWSALSGDCTLMRLDR